ncbi:MAG: patatin-like phospholipase family protein [Bernardetiaceae bacterium]|nr:patatin-like phospholipase family protein [Bernardetiaceae bacterium]
MEVSDFTAHPKIRALLAYLRHRQIDKKIFSDVEDAEGFQYVDLVQQGGGVLGVSLLGYTYILECMKIRFLGYAGTSAGAINAMLLAAMPFSETQTKSERILVYVANQSLKDFIDGSAVVREFVSQIPSLREDMQVRKLLWHGLRALNHLWTDWGLAQGDYFYNWLVRILEEQGVSCWKDLKQNLESPLPLLRIRKGVFKNTDNLRARLAIVATDVTTETKVIFPQMSKLYWEKPMLVQPANFIRASMSIPLVFKPFKVKNIPQGEVAKQKWRELVDYRGAIPKEVYFVDGGLVSNFPIDIFHTLQVPRMPTFGVKIGVPRAKPNEFTNVLGLSKAIIDASRQVADYNFLLQNRDYRQLISWIDVKGYDWLDFRLGDEAKITLFLQGAEAAARFLEKFDWKAYKELRKYS